LHGSRIEKGDENKKKKEKKILSIIGAHPLRKKKVPKTAKGDYSNYLYSSEKTVRVASRRLRKKGGQSLNLRNHKASIAFTTSKGEDITIREDFSKGLVQASSGPKQVRKKDNFILQLSFSERRKSER